MQNTPKQMTIDALASRYTIQYYTVLTQSSQISERGRNGPGKLVFVKLDIPQVGGVVKRVRDGSSESIVINLEDLERLQIFDGCRDGACETVLLQTKVDCTQTKQNKTKQKKARQKKVSTYWFWHCHMFTLACISIIYACHGISFYY
jgi:hypothetical protein